MLKAADQTRDLSGQDAHRILSIYETPEYVKKANQLQKCGAADMPRTGYLEPIGKLYPTHTAAATWLSAAFLYTKFAEEGSTVPQDLEEKLLAVATHFGIRPDIEKVAAEAKAAATDDEAKLADDQFALVLVYDNGVKERKYPMRNAMETKTAAEYLHKYRADFPFNDRQRIAYKILAKAAEYGADIAQHRDELDRTAGLGTCAAADAANMLQQRALTIRSKNAEVATEMSKLAEMVAAKGSHFRHYDKMAEIAGTIDQLDREYGLINCYGDGDINFPEDTLFAVTEKIAAELSNELVTLSNGSVYNRLELENLPADVYEQGLGEKVAEVATAGVLVTSEKVAAVLPALSATEANAFDIAAGAAGVIPVARAQAKTGFSMLNDPVIKEAATNIRKTATTGSLWDRVNRKKSLV